MNIRLSLAYCWTVVAAGLVSAQTPEMVECSPCYRADDRFWAQGELLIGWIRSSALPPLVSTSPPGTAVEQAGILGTPGASVLVGDESVNGGAHAGIRATFGAWLDEDACYGVEAQFLGLNNRDQKSRLSSDGSTILARPFVDATTGQPSAELVALPDVLAGTVDVSARSGGLIGAGALFRRKLCCTPCARIDALVGYRYINYDEELTVEESLTTLVPIIPTTNIRVFDSFHTNNEFHGVDLGIETQFQRGCWSIDVLAKVALGNLRREVSIDGQTTVGIAGAGTFNSTGGLLALSSNIGQFHSDTFMAVPELGLTVGYHICPQVRLNVGYSLLWLPDVARAADQIDLTVNPGLLPPPEGPFLPARPHFELQESSIWVQGLRFGVAFQF